MAQLKDLIVNGASRFLNTVYAKTINLSLNTTTEAPISVENTAAGDSNNYLWTISSLAPNLTTNGAIQIARFGKEAANNNLAFLGFHYVASGSTSNHVALGFYGDTINDTKKIRFYPGGKLAIGEATPNYNLNVTGNVRFKNANTAVADKNFIVQGTGGYLSIGSQGIQAYASSSDYAISAEDVGRTLFLNYAAGGDVTIGGNVLPKTTNTFALGASDTVWQNVYATTVIGALSGRAAYANSASRAIYATSSAYARSSMYATSSSFARNSFYAASAAYSSRASYASLTSTTNSLAYFSTTSGTFASSGILIDPTNKRINGYITVGNASGGTIGTNATVEGSNNIASGSHSHAEGYITMASATAAHAEGRSTTASGISSHAEGRYTKALKDSSHAEGYGTEASGSHSHAEGYSTIASGDQSHAEGYDTTASGGYGSHAEGSRTTASGRCSHAEGNNTTAQRQSQHVFGEYNILDTGGTDSTTRGNYVEIIGNGSSSARSNARTLDWDGNEWLAGGLTLNKELILNNSYAYGDILPASPTTGQLFFTPSSGSGGMGVLSISTTTDKIYMLGIKSPSDQNYYYNTNVYAQNNVLYGAAWNDYAEYRESFEIEPGRVIIELGNGKLVKSTERLQPGAEIISDTYGFVIGKGNPRCSTPVAVAGRVLAYPDNDKYTFFAGDAVCSGPNGTVSKMSREEIKEYPERIIGIVSEIPEYDTWGANNIKVNNRIWIKLR